MLLIISCPFQKSLENLFLVKVRCLEFEKYGLCAFYKQLLLFHYSYMDLFIYLFMLYLFCGNKVELQWGNIFVNFVLFTRDRTLTNETQLNCFISLSYSLIYIRCVKSYSAKFVRNHSLIRYFLHFDWLLPSTDLKGSFKVALIM